MGTYHMISLNIQMPHDILHTFCSFCKSLIDFTLIYDSILQEYVILLFEAMCDTKLSCKFY